MRKTTIALISVVCFCFASMTAQARTTSTNNVHHVSLAITVTAVDTTAKTVTLESGTDKASVQAYKVTAFTKITVDGKTATINEIQSGMTVVDVSTGAGSLSKIDLVSASAPAATKTKKKKSGN